MANGFNKHFNPKTVVEGGRGNEFYKERVKFWFFVTFNIILSRIFPENFIKKL